MMKGLMIFCFLFILISGQSTTTDAAAQDSTTVFVSTQSDAGNTVAATASTAVACVDTIADCSKYIAQCSDPNYQTIMYQKCRKTCNLCNACLDLDARCPQWARNGFCANPFYQQIWSECRKSCAICK
uniref:ShKT domain-containing protein n=1 Tax=Panagrolaimus superbus TaxID=310955 RepID=A0A914YBT3_9BILA